MSDSGDYAFVRACLQDGNQTYPNWVSLKFVNGLLKKYLEEASMSDSVYMLVEGKLNIKEWREDLDDGKIIRGSDCYIFVTGFQIITGKKNPAPNVKVRNPDERKAHQRRSGDNRN